MARVQIEAKLIDDVYLHQAVNSDGDVAVAQNAAGLMEIFSVGTDGKIYNIAPSPESDTGWTQADLQCPSGADVIAALRDPQDRIVVCAANQTTMQVFTLRESDSGPRWDPKAWHTIKPGPDITGRLTFYELQMRVNAQGLVEFLLLYFQRMADPQWHYTYRVGRADTAASTWGIGFNTGVLYQGSNPVYAPAMTVGRSAGLPSLFLYWREAETIRLWRNIDGTPDVMNLTLPDASDDLRRLIALGDGADSELYAAGLIHPDAVNGLYRYDWSAKAFRLLSGGADVVDAEGAFGPLSGYDIVAVGGSGDLFHVHGSPDGTTWTPFSPMGSRAASVIGMVTDSEGPVFAVSTIDKTLWRYYRDPPALDWQSEQVALQTAAGERVVWYTTNVAALDDENRAIPGCALTIACDETSEVMLNGRTEIVGPNRPLSVETDASGTLTIQQSTAELANLFVPPLVVTLATGESDTVKAYQDTNDRLYRLTGQELRDAKGRDQQPVLPPDHQGEADTLAAKIATAMSLGRAPTGPLVTWESLGSPVPGRARLVRSATGEPVVGGIEIDVGDLFEGIKDTFVRVTEITIRAVGDHVVEGLWLAIDTTAGAYEVFVNVLEQAYDAVRTVFEMVGAVFARVLEWLGTLFDWQAIQAKAREVAQLIQQGFAAIPVLMQQAGLPGSLDTIFQGLQDQAAQGFQYVRERVGVSSLGTGATEAGFTNPGSAYTFNGQNVNVSANWLLDRMRPHLAGVSLPVDLNGPGWAGFDAMLPTIAGALTGTTLQIIENLTGVFRDLLSPSQALGVSFDRMFDQFQTLSSGLLEFMKTVARSFVEALTTLSSSTALHDLFQTPITIPVISDLLKTLGLGSSFTLMDVVSLLVAVPLHVIESLVPGGAPAAVDKKIYLTLGVFFGVIMLLTTINDLLKEAVMALAAIPAVVWLAALAAVLVAYDQSEPKAVEILLATLAYFAFQGLSLYVAIKLFGDRTATRGMAGYAIGDAAFLNVLAVIWAVRTSFTSEKPKAWQILANHVGTLPDIFRWTDLVWSPPEPKPLPARLMVAAIDVIGNGALMAGALGDYFTATEGGTMPKRMAAGVA